jgi:hypothetical protein
LKLGEMPTLVLDSAVSSEGGSRKKELVLAPASTWRGPWESTGMSTFLTVKRADDALLSGLTGRT